MQSKRIQKLLRKKKSDSGFTLLELLTGLIMSIFVTGALGFGLYQILKTTSKESLKTSARNEASRAIEFISDELRRAQSIEVDMSNAKINTVAPGYTVPTGGTVRLALNIPNVSERIIYSVAPPQASSPWKGPLVVYRWGPPLNSDGEYTNATNVGSWLNQALIDQVDNTTQSLDCDGDGTNESYQGFFACIVDDDGDGITEDGATDTNGDGVVNAEDSDDDIDGLAATAQLFLTGGIYTTTGDDTNYRADTKAVARAKNVTVDNEEEGETPPIKFKTLGAIYNCRYEIDDKGTSDPSDDEVVGIPWSMRMDFGNNPSDSDDTTTWIHDPKRKAQPIDISTNNALTITASPIKASNCLSEGNNGRDGKEDLSIYQNDPDGHTVDHTIEFMQPPTLEDGSPNPEYNADAWKTFNGDNTSGTYDNPDVKGDGTVMVYKNDSVIPADFFDGYDSDGDGTPDQDSLGKFLLDKGYARYTNGSNATGGYTIEGLENNERIIAFEVGQTDQAHPGFDVQDAVFIMSNDEFKKEY